MAINLRLSAAWAKYGSLAAIGNQPAFSIAFRVRPQSSPFGSRLAQKWTGGTSTQAFLCSINDTDELGFLISDSGGTRFGKKTTGLNLTGDEEYGVVCTWITGSPCVIHIVVNGNDETVTDWINTGNPATINSTANDIGVGTDINDCYRGDYADFAVWNTEVPLEVAKAISLGASPAIWQHGLVLYDPLTDSSNASDIIGGLQASLTGAADATLPLRHVGIMPFMPTLHKATAVATTIPVFMNHYRNQGVM